MRNVIILIALILFVGCTDKKNNSSKPTITVTIEPLRYFTQAIAGDKFNVVSMVPEGTSPETYDPTPQQLVNLGKSVAYFKIGCIGFERVWMEKLQDNNPELKIFDTSKGVEFIKEKESTEESIHNNEVHSDSNHNEHSHHHGGIDPHIWNSTTNANIIADNIFNALCNLSQKEKEYFSIRRDSIKSVISKVDLKIREMLNNADSTFIIYHPALSYYAKEYGLKQICIEEEGKEPTPTYLKNLIDNSRKQKPHVIFIQKEFDIRNAELIANELNLNVVTINPLSYDWKKEMIEPAKALKKYE